jgi:transcriptional regulator with XRE-family HTH domain
MAAGLPWNLKPSGRSWKTSRTIGKDDISIDLCYLPSSSQMMADKSRNLTPALPFCHVRLKTKKPKPPNYPKYLKSIGVHIRKKRLDLVLPQRDVAAQIGVSQNTIYNWERNATSPQVHDLPGIIQFLGYNPLPPVRMEGERLVRNRYELGLTRKEIAKRLGIDPTTLSRYERR